MKTNSLLCAIVLALASVASLADTEILNIGFEAEEGYALGKITGQKGWTGASSGHNPSSVYAVTNRAALVKTGSQALCMRTQDGKSPCVGRSFKLDSTEGLYVRMSLDIMYVEGEFNKVKFLCGNEVEMAALSANNSGSSHSLYLDFYNIQTASAQTAYVGSFEPGVFHHYEMLFDPAKKIILSATVDDTVMTNTADLVMGYRAYTNASKPDPARFALERDMSVDNMLVQTVPGSSDPPSLVITPESLSVPRSAKSATMTLMNQGSGQFQWTAAVEGSPEWLSVYPVSGTCAGSSKLTLSLDRDVMTDGFYRAIINIDGGEAGQRSAFVTAASGRVIYYEDFEPPFMKEGRLSGQNGWAGDDQAEGNEMLVTNVDYCATGNCAYMVRGGGYEGYYHDVNSDRGGLMKLSFKLFKGSDADEDASSFWLQNDYWNRSISFWFWRYGESFYIYKFNGGQGYGVVGGHEFPLDTWLDFSITLDYRSHRMTALSLGDFSTNYVVGLPLKEDIPNFTKFCMSCSSSSKDCRLLIDNVKAEQIERPPLAVPTWTGILSLGSDLNAVTNPVFNLGSKKFDYSIRVLEHQDSLKAVPASGSIASAGEVVLKLDRKGLENGFYRARVVMEYTAEEGVNSGALTSLVTFAQGGYYYASEFEGGDYRLGPVNGQDTWSVVSRSGQAPEIALLDSDQALRFPEEAAVVSPMRVPAESQFTMRLRYFMEDNDSPCVLMVSQMNGELQKEHSDSDGCLPVFIRKDLYSHVSVVGVYRSGEEEFTPLAEAPLGVWNDLAFSADMDLANASATDLTLNDTTLQFYPGEIVLSPVYDQYPLDQIYLGAYNENDEEEEPDFTAGIYVDNLTVADPAIPEPGAALLLLLAALALPRRK